jgi:large subunit ribosomal protein L30
MKLKVTQIRSQIGHTENHKRIVKALGLGKIGKSRVHDDNPVIRGMIEKVKFLVAVENVSETKIDE